MPPIIPEDDSVYRVFATPAALITKALKEIGVVGFGRTATAMEIADGLESLNLLLDELGLFRENISVRTLENFTLTIGQSVYGIGPGSDFPTVRPIRIEQAFYRDENGTDTPINCSMQDREYLEISSKNESGTPSKLFYKPTAPIGTVYLNYAPMTALQLYINSWKPFSKVTNASDGTQLVLPAGYEAAITYNLAKRLCPANKKSCPQELADAALSSLQAVQSAYGETNKIIEWDTPSSGSTTGNFFNMES